MTKATTREEWLEAAAAKMAVRYFDKPPVAVVSVGFPLGRKKAPAAGSVAIGQCFSHECSEGDRHEIFISPELAEPVPVLATLLHELVHAAVGIEHGHKAPFKKLATKCGLEGKMRSTVPGERLAKELDEMAKKLGEYPHAKLTVGGRTIKKQTTRLLKIYCPDCGWTARATEKWIAIGLPTCVCGATFTADEVDDGGDE